MEDRKATILKTLKKNGQKLTSQRRAIIDVIVKYTPLHPSARFVYQEARKRVKGLSLSTVYYTLNELSRHGIIKTLEFDKRGNRYEGNTSSHLNLVCLRCGSIQDFPRALPVSSEEVERRTGFRPSEMRFEYYGFCKKCLRRETYPRHHSVPGPERAKKKPDQFFHIF